MKKITFYLLLLTSGFISCSSDQNNSSDSITPCDKYNIGTLLNRDYSNAFFCLNLTIPNDWTILNEKDLISSLDDRKQMLKSDNSLNEKKWDKTLAVTDILLAITTDVENNTPLVIFSSVNLDLDPNINKELDHLAASANSAQTMYSNYEMNLTFSEPIQKMINGKSFYSYETTIKGEGFLAYQRIFQKKLEIDY